MSLSANGCAHIAVARIKLAARAEIPSRLLRGDPLLGQAEAVGSAGNALPLCQREVSGPLAYTRTCVHAHAYTRMRRRGGVRRKRVRSSKEQGLGRRKGMEE